MARCDVLVTGARGFVGRHVIERARLAGMDPIPAEGDLRDAGVVDAAVAATRPRAVVHLAATPRGVPPWEALRDDLAMVGNLLAAIAKHAPDAPLLVSGSAAQYGMGGAGELSEQHATVPESAYGAVKSALELAVCSTPLRGGVRVIFTRSFNHIGPGQGFEAPAAQWARAVLAAEAAGGGTVRVGDVSVVRDFLDVRDVADAYLALAASTAAGVVNVCSGVARPLHQVLDLIVNASAAPVVVEREPALMRALDPPRVVGDASRLSELTGWKPAIALERSVADLLSELRNREPVGPDLHAVGS